NLMEKFEFSEKQAQAILEMRLQRLTGLERQAIIDELKEVADRIAWLKKVLGDVSEIYKIIMEELETIRQKYSNPRLTKIVQADGEMNEEDLIANEDVIVTLTSSGYIKRIP